MERELEIEESKALATGLFQGAQVVSEYMRRHAPMISEAEVTSQIGYKETSVKGLWMRAYAWLQTIEKLNDPLDFQAISVGNRALLEIAVDLVWLHNDKTNSSAWKMYWWGQSEKLRTSEQIVNFYQNESRVVPDIYEAQETFCRNEKLNVENMRKTLWPKRKKPDSHPKRWTGNANLFDDIVAADQYYGPVIQREVGVTLAEYYRTEYPKMNWRIHSGVASFWNQPPQAFFLMCGFGFKSCADFGMLCTKIALTDLGLDKVLPELEQEWSKIKRRRDYVYIHELYKHHSGTK
jgi:hypothetical protein